MEEPAVRPAVVEPLESKLLCLLQGTHMRIPCIGLALLLGTALISCNNDNDTRREGPDARKAGRDAYRASQAAKRDAKEIERELRNAGRKFREGWDEARSEDEGRRKKQ